MTDNTTQKKSPGNDDNVLPFISDAGRRDKASQRPADAQRFDHVNWGDVLCLLAYHCWGAPDSSARHEWRWGENGDRKINFVTGEWTDFISGRRHSGLVLDFVVKQIRATRDYQKAVRWLIERGYIEAAPPHPKGRAAYEAEQAQRAKERRQRDAEAARAQEIWAGAEAVSDEAGAEQLVAAYLRQRHLAIVPMLARVLPKQASWKLGVTGAPGLPCIVWPIVDLDGSVTAVEVMVLHADGHHAWDPSRKTYGSPPRGAFVPLFMPAHATTLIVGEGVETVLSGIEASGHAGVACTSAGRLADVVLPQGITEVIVAVDDDPAGFDALHTLAPRLQQNGIKVHWLGYDGDMSGFDWNDALKAGSDLRSDIDAASDYGADAPLRPKWLHAAAPPPH